jgi:hypothetical protein
MFNFFSEMRAAYEVTNDRKNWEVIMGEFKDRLAVYFYAWDQITIKIPNPKMSSVMLVFSTPLVS